MVLKIATTFVVVFLALASSAQQVKFGIDKIIKDSPNTSTPFCVPNNEAVRAFLIEHDVLIKYETENWIFITTTPSFINESFNSGELNNYYLEFAPPALLNDTSRAVHHVQEAHDGVGLSKPYTGKGVLIGYVDTGVDFNHPDFKDTNGNTRVMRYWDHSLTSGGPINTAYGYGVVWDSSYINAGTCTSTDNHSHGTTVTGAGSGNGFSTGYNQGMAPDSKIIMVETNFNLPNWTLTVADACDYIFKVADTMGVPAVVNLSLGTYFGSHDGNDPASEYIESLLDEKDGRIVVAACGNSGNQGKYHCGSDVTSDTSFVWFYRNPAGGFSGNTVFFDLWSNLTATNFDYSIDVRNPSNNYEKRGQTIYRSAMNTINTSVFDTIRNNGNILATVEVYNYTENNAMHFQVLIRNADTANYVYGFNTTGTGRFDLWSGQWLGYNNMVTAIPSVIDVPNIIHYNMPDTLQSIVSSWNCSEKVISVGNIRNRETHPNFNGTTSVPSDMTPHGKLSINSSKGPNRNNVLKPDIVATGDVALSPGPLWFLANPANYAKMDSGGWHMGNGGTSMSSPVIAGIAALFLERCPKASYLDFKESLINHAFPNTYTGVLPNLAYGNGLADAHAMLIENNFTATLSADTNLCVEPNIVTVNSSSTYSTSDWSDGTTGVTNANITPGPLSAIVYNDYGCPVQSDTLIFNQLIVATIDPIQLFVASNELTTLSSTNYQWTLNGVDLVGETGPTLAIAPPYGTYTCYATSVDGCVTETAPITVTLGIDELMDQGGIVYPNPTNGKVYLPLDLDIVNVKCVDISGKEAAINLLDNNELDLSGLESGQYIIYIKTNSQIFQSKIIRL